MYKRIFYLLDLDRFDTDQSRFLKYYVSNSIKTIRWGVVLATFLYAAFAVLDVYMAPQTYHKIWLIRFGFAIPFSVAVFAVTFSNFFIRFSQPIMVLTFLILSLGFIPIIAIYDTYAPNSRFHYA